PKCFRNEKIVFTFDRRPVAEATVLKIEEPGRSKCDATGRYERFHKVFWNPKEFVRYNTKTGASQWIGPVFHGTREVFKKFKPQEEAAGMTYFTDDPEYADYFSSPEEGIYYEGS